PYLIKFPTQSVCEWVLDKPWHVYHLPIGLRRWSMDVKLIQTRASEVLMWGKLVNVPPHLRTHLGFGLIASLLGTPMSKFVKIGLEVKVCVLIVENETRKESITLNMGGEPYILLIEYPMARTYKHRPGTNERQHTGASVDEEGVKQQSVAEVGVEKIQTDAQVAEGENVEVVENKYPISEPAP
ncbi:hypothetical protein LINPERPRIM_LOCUS21118, partial [Linum perenne]